MTCGGRTRWITPTVPSPQQQAWAASKSTRIASTRSFVLDDDYDDYNPQDGPSYDYEDSSPPAPSTSSTDALNTHDMSDEELLATMGDWDERVAKFNTIHLTGRIGNNPEPRYFDDGKVVVNLSLATKRKYHSLERQMEKIQWGQEETEWYELEIWGSIAEFASKFVDRGSHVSVIGNLQIDEWNDRETGELRNKVKIVVRDFVLLESKEEADARRQRSKGGRSYKARDDVGPSSGGSGNFF